MKTPLTRLTSYIYSEYEPSRPLQLLSMDTADYLKLVRKYNLAIYHEQWDVAKKLKGKLSSYLYDARRELDYSRERLEAKQSTFTPSWEDIYLELKGLFEEFPTAEINLRDKSLSVTSDFITLGDISLGRFEVQLDLDEMSYKVIALDPNPAAANEDVTHPHVQSESLCEGDGGQAIENALNECRFCDFFTLIMSILETYNSGSPYVSLEEWEGEPCNDCGCSMDSDEGYSCYEQGVRICSDCAYHCCDCENSFCSREITCCDDCSKDICCKCLSEESVCDSCQTKRDEEREQEELEDELEDELEEELEQEHV